MTLVSRNRIILSLFLLAVTFILATGSILVLAIMKGTILFPETFQRLFDLPTVPLLSANMFAAILSAIVLLLYSAVMLGISLVNFEKTRSLEITCFAFFALGCLFEGIRIWLPVFNFWANHSSLYVLIGQLLFFGRTLSVANLLALALLALELENKQNIEMNLLVVTAVAALLARLTPIDTLIVPSNCSIRFGYEKMFLTVTAVSFSVGFLSMLYQSNNRGSQEYTRVAVGFLLLSFGYLTLTQADSILFFAVGSLLLVAGSITFLVNLHRFYTWK
ncbi:MAG: hypothetical protein IKW26_10305 [Treponema sp.]|nr:hypothetical protein [Treponema sp.]